MTPLRIVFTALLPFASGYLMSYLLRAVNAVVAPDLVRDAGLSPAELGLLTAAYLGAFALFQLPLGVLLDRYGPRRVQSVLLLVAAMVLFFRKACSGGWLDEAFLLVPAAVVFDLAPLGRFDARPSPAMAYDACEQAAASGIAEGDVGALALAS